jgi:hypothetical protein
MPSLRDLRKLLVRSVSEPVEGGVRVSREAVDEASSRRSRARSCSASPSVTGAAGEVAAEREDVIGLALP